MSASDLVQRLRSLEILLELDGDKLRLSGPKSALTPELHAELKERRDELVEFLRAARGDAGGASLVPVKATGSRPPLFVHPGHNGDVFCFRPLSQVMDAEQPLFAFQPQGVDGREAPLESVPAMAARFVDAILEHQPDGPYHVGGYCTGGVVAFEAAQELVRRGAEVRSLVLFGTPSVTGYRLSHRLVAAPARAAAKALRIVRGQQPGPAAPLPEPTSSPEDRARVEEATITAVRNYEAEPYPGRLVLFVPNRDPRTMFAERYMDWESFARGGFAVHAGPDGTLHSRMLREPAVESVAPVLAAELAGRGARG